MCVQPARRRRKQVSLETAQTAADPLLPGLVVLCHGRFHTKHRGPMAAIEPLLPFSTLSFDARGMGESEGKTGYSNIQVRFLCLWLVGLINCSRKK